MPLVFFQFSGIVSSMPARHPDARAAQAQPPVEQRSAAEIAPLVPAIGRVQRQYDAIYPGRFSITPHDGLFFNEPVLIPQHTPHFETTEELQAFVDALPPRARTVINMLPGDVLKETAAIGIAWANDLASGALHNVENIGRTLLRTRSLRKLAAEGEDEISHTFVQLIVGDPVIAAEHLRTHGFENTTHQRERFMRKPVAETIPDTGSVVRLTKDALLFVVNGARPIKKVETWERIVSAIPKWDAILDVRKAASALRHTFQGRPVDELAAYGIAFAIDMTDISSPGIDAPSVAPFVQLGIRAKEIMVAEIMATTMQSQPQTNVESNLRTGFTQVFAELGKKRKNRRLLRRAEQAVNQLTLKAAGIQELQPNQAMPQLTDQQILMSTRLTAQEQDRLIMGRQILNARKVADTERRAASRRRQTRRAPVPQAH